MNREEIASFTCLLFREGSDDTVGGGGRRDAEELLARLGKRVFDPIRSCPEFVTAEEKIRRLLQ